MIATPKPCSKCGVRPRTPGGGNRLCAECRQARIAPAPCSSCGNPNPVRSVRGQRVCDDCRPPKRRPRPCSKCGDTNPTRSVRGQHLCDDCRDIAKWQTRQRERARNASRRKPCRGCGRPKGPGKGAYCPACRAKRQRAASLCGACGERPRRAYNAKYCDRCQEVAERAKRRYWRERSARAQAANPGWRKEYDRARWLRIKRKNAKRSNGKRSNGGGRRNDPLVLPAGPLAVAVERWLARCGEPLTSADRLVGVSERSVREWRDGGRTLVQLGTADQVLTSIGLCWFDVWPPDEYPEGVRVWDPEGRVAVV